MAKNQLYLAIYNIDVIKRANHACLLLHVKAPVGGSVSVLNLQEVVTRNANVSTSGSQEYLHALCQQSFPGPLVGGSVGSKELNKWIDERIANFEASNMDYRKAQILKLLLSLLKIACQHYGKLRSPFGSETALRVSHILMR